MSKFLRLLTFCLKRNEHGFFALTCSLNVKRVERVEIHSKGVKGVKRRTTRFRVENFHPKMSVEVKFSLSKEWNIVIKNPLSLLLECFSTYKRVVLRVTPIKSGNPLCYI